MEKKRILKIPVNEYWFDLIWSERKTEEIRVLSPYWKQRLIGKEYDLIEIFLGYGKDVPTMIFKWKGCRITPKEEETDHGTGGFFAIDISEYMGSKNVITPLHEKKARWEMLCNAYPFVEQAKEKGADFTEDEDKAFMSAKKAKGRIKKGKVYLKKRGERRDDGRRWVYSALPELHAFNTRQKFYLIP